MGANLSGLLSRDRTEGMAAIVIKTAMLNSDMASPSLNENGS
jgi:hypothetical protein